MAAILPFSAIRPSPEKVSLVVSRSYEDYSDEEREAILRFNPFSFLHIVNPGFKYQQQPEGRTRFQMVKNRFMEFCEEGTLIKDVEPGYYVYALKTKKHFFYGFYGSASVEDYLNGHIKPHESTIAYREQTFCDYLETVGFNAEPVLLAYPSCADAQEVLERTMKETPLYHFCSTDKHEHTLWRIADPNRTEKLTDAFAQLSDLYIADGHHRCASSALLAQKKSFSDNEASRYFMSFFVPENMLHISVFSRLVTDLNNLRKEEFLVQLDTYFRIENLGTTLYKPGKRHHFCMYLDGEFYSLYLRKSYAFTHVLSQLDTQILYETVLSPILGIQDLRNDKRIQYLHGDDGILEMKNAVDKEQFAVGFIPFPVTVQELKDIADNGFTMPPKSTYIEPKLTSGLTMYQF